MNCQGDQRRGDQEDAYQGKPREAEGYRQPVQDEGGDGRPLKLYGIPQPAAEELPNPGPVLLPKAPAQAQFLLQRRKLFPRSLDPPERHGAVSRNKGKGGENREGYQNQG